MEKQKWGGFRPGAGRKSLSEGKARMTIYVSNQTREILDKYSKGLGISNSDLIDQFIFLYLEDCKDILHCKKCHAPIAWTSMLTVGAESGEGEIVCTQCGEINIIK